MSQPQEALPVPRPNTGKGLEVYWERKEAGHEVRKEVGEEAGGRAC